MSAVSPTHADRDDIASTNQPPYHLLLAIAAAFLVANLILLGLRRYRFGEIGHCLIIGGLASQAALVAIWTAVVTEPIARRIGFAIVLSALGLLTYCTGYYLTPQWLNAWQEYQWRFFLVGSIHATAPIAAVVSFAIFEIQFMAVFILAIRIYFSATRRVLTFRDSSRQGAGRFQYSMQHVMLGSVFVAMGVGWSSLVFDTEAGILGPEIGRIPRLGPINLLYSILLAVSMLVCIEIALGERRRHIWSAIGVLAIPALACLGVGVLTVLFGTQVMTMESFLTSAVLFACFEVITTLVLLSARWMGFRLSYRLLAKSML